MPTEARGEAARPARPRRSRRARTPRRGARGRRRRPLWKQARRRGKQLLARLAAQLAPPVYAAYMALVWRTSRHVDHGLERIPRLAAQHGGLVTLLWHEEVFAAPYLYVKCGVRAHVMASRSGAGEIITKLLHRCGHTVSRGGTSRRDSRSRPMALREVFRYLDTHEGAIFCTPVDGSQGPRYRVKPGSVLVARRCGVPVALMRIWYRRRLHLRTWDRAAIPLPFNEIHTYGEGPFWLPADGASRAGFERFRCELEDALIELAARSYRDLCQARPDALVPAPRPTSTR